MSGHPFHDVAFVFVLSGKPSDAAADERRLLPLIRSVHGEGATVGVVCQKGSEVAEDVRAMGLSPAEYRLDQSNLVRTRSRLRKYLKRRGPAIAHSSGTWGNVILALAARTLPDVSVVMSVWPTSAGPQATKSIHRRLEVDRAKARADLVLVSDAVSQELLADRGVPAWRMLDYPGRASDQELLARYREFLRR